MQFTVFAIATRPDTVTARSVLGLHDLSDAEVAKVMFHRQAQSGGQGEALRFDQLGIATLTLVRHSMDYVQIDNHRSDQIDETDILESFYDAVLRFGHMVSWHGRERDLPVIHARSLVHHVRQPAYWDGLAAGELEHIDLRDHVCTGGDDCPSLDAMARLLGYPGMLEHAAGQVWERCLAGDLDYAQRYCEMRAINTYMAALRVLSVSGRLTRADAMRAQSKIHEMMLKADIPHFDRYLDAWEYAN